MSKHHSHITIGALLSVGLLIAAVMVAAAIVVLVNCGMPFSHGS